MRFKGKFKGASRDFESGRICLSFEMLEGHIADLDEIKDKDLSIEAKKFYDHRSDKANRLLWSCIGDIVDHLRAENKKVDKWEIYLKYIKRQNQFVPMQIELEAFPKFQKKWREVEIVGQTMVNGIDMLEVHCYFGSSTYNSKEFGFLLDDIIEDMKDMGIPLPTSEEMQIALKEVEENGKK